MNFNNNNNATVPACGNSCENILCKNQDCLFYTDDEDFDIDDEDVTCSKCSNIKTNDVGWDYCACLEAYFCPSCSPTNTCFCEGDGSCDCANCDWVGCDWEDWKVKTLKDLCKKEVYKGYSKFNKKDLIQFIINKKQIGEYYLFQPIELRDKHASN